MNALNLSHGAWRGIYILCRRDTETMHFVEGRERLESIFGYWPNFHDAEVLSLTYERGGEWDFHLTAAIHVFEMVPVADEKGYFPLIKHTRATLRFEGCVDDDIAGFNQQNVLSQLLLEWQEDAHPSVPIHVNFRSSYGVGGTLRCGRVVVQKAVPMDLPEGE